MSKNKKFNVAVIGATGMLGETLLEILYQRKFPVDQIYPLASDKSADYNTVNFGRHELTVLSTNTFDFSKVDIVFCMASAKVASKYVPKALEAGCFVVDNSSHYRMDKNIPLVIPEVNPDVIKEGHRLIANPNCSTIQLLVALKPLYDIFKIERIDVATYQSVSGTGKPGIDELITQTSEILNGYDPSVNTYDRQIAFNLIPFIGDIEENGFCDEENKIIFESQKILQDEDLEISATSVRVPVIYGHSEAVTITCSKPCDITKATEALKAASGVKFYSKSIPSPFGHLDDKNDVLVSRLRMDLFDKHKLSMFVIGDNVKKGGALNSVQIAELLVDKGFLN